MSSALIDRYIAAYNRLDLVGMLAVRIVPRRPRDAACALPCGSRLREEIGAMRC